MASTPYSGSTNIIGALGTNPAERALTTQQFKDKFDQFATEFATWFNATHIGTDKSHIGAIGSAAGVTPNPSTTSLTYVDLPEMSFSLTTSGGDILVFFTGMFLHDTAGKKILLQLYVDAVGGGVIYTSAPIINYWFNMASIFRFTGIAAGAHTIKAKWAVDGGTGTAATTYRYLTALEVKQ